jgi:hypothetical protein
MVLKVKGVVHLGFESGVEIWTQCYIQGENKLCRIVCA